MSSLPRTFPTLSIVDHPLVRHKITLLRDRATPTKQFKELVDEIAMLMAYEATRELALDPISVETPLETAHGWSVRGKKLTLVPILRAGDVSERDFLLLDPMLATGGSAAAAISSLKRAGASRIRFLCLVAAPEGVERVAREHPDVPILAAALDRELNANGYILPGLGDAGDRLFGTR